MVRYLIYFSYIGTKFNGSQRQTSYGMEHLRLSTVQDILERSLVGIKAKRDPYLVLSSRTDAGVHAMAATAHFDVNLATPEEHFHPKRIMHMMNKFFHEQEHAVRVNRSIIVPEDFHCRHKAKSRSYLYRIAVCHDDAPVGIRNTLRYPIHDAPRSFLDDGFSYRVFPPFDALAFVSAARLFEGHHNFLTFTKPHKERSRGRARDPVRTMNICSVSPGHGFLSAHDPYQQGIQYWDVTLQSSGFLHNQVRKMVGTLVAVAQGRVTKEQVKYMLDNPSHGNWISRIYQAPPHGLFLKEVNYDEKDFELPEDYFEVLQKFKCSYQFKRWKEYTKLHNLIAGRKEQLSET